MITWFNYFLAPALALLLVGNDVSQLNSFHQGASGEVEEQQVRLPSSAIFQLLAYIGLNFFSDQGKIRSQENQAMKTKSIFNAPCAIVLLPHPAPLVLVDGDQPALVVLCQPIEPVQEGWVQAALKSVITPHITMN